MRGSDFSAFDFILHLLVSVELKGNGYTFREDKSFRIVFFHSEKGSNLKGKNLLLFSFLEKGLI